MLGISTFLNRWRNRQRLIFSVWIDGSRSHSDPIGIDRRLEQHGGENWAALVQLVADLRKPLSPVAAAAMGEDAVSEHRRKFNASVKDLVTLARKVFDLPELSRSSGTGVTDADTIRVLGEYLDFANALAENASPLA